MPQSRIFMHDATYMAYRTLAKRTGLTVPILAGNVLQRAIPTGGDFDRDLARIEAGDFPQWFRDMLPVDDPEIFLKPKSRTWEP